MRKRKNTVATIGSELLPWFRVERKAQCGGKFHKYLDPTIDRTSAPTKNEEVRLNYSLPIFVGVPRVPNTNRRFSCLVFMLLFLIFIIYSLLRVS
jgi:hypothetical protein